MRDRSVCEAVSPSPQRQPRWIGISGVAGLAWFLIAQALGWIWDVDLLLGLSYVGLLATSVAGGWATHLRMKADDMAQRVERQKR